MASATRCLRNSTDAPASNRAGNSPEYAIDRNGSQVMSFESSVQPDDKRLLEALRKLLDARKTVMRTT